MAFELPPLPNFQTQVPQAPDALADYGKFIQLKDMLARQQLIPGQLQTQQANLQSIQTENELKQLQLQGQKALTQYWSDPTKYAGETAAGSDQLAGILGLSPNDPLMDTIRGQMRAGVPAPMAFVEAKSALAVREQYNKSTKEQQAVMDSSLSHLQKLSAEALAEKDPLKKSNLIELLKPEMQEWARFDPSLNGIIPQLNGQNFDAFANMIAAQDELHKYVKGQAEAAKAQQEVINPATGMSPQEQSEAAKQVSVETNPAVQAGKIQVAKAEALARGQIQLELEPLRMQISQTFANQKDARDKIETTVLKPYQEKMTDVNMARNAIAQASSNPVAARAAVFKMIGVAQPTGSHRVLPAEITAFRYPGGIGSQIVERFNDFLKGEPWTPEIAQAANAFIDSQAGAAQTSLNSGIDNTNKLYGTQVGGGLKSQEPAAHPFFSQFGGTKR